MGWEEKTVKSILKSTRYDACRACNAKINCVVLTTEKSKHIAIALKMHVFTTIHRRRVEQVKKMHKCVEKEIL